MLFYKQLKIILTNSKKMLVISFETWIDNLKIKILIPNCFPPFIPEYFQ